MAVTGAAATENTVSMTNATRVNNARNEGEELIDVGGDIIR